MPFPFYQQLDAMDCGPTALRMIAAYYGRQYSLPFLRQRCHIDKEGVSVRGIVAGAEKIGLRPLPVKVSFEGGGSAEVGLTDAPLPAIVHWDQRHFVVVYKITGKQVKIADPARGRVNMSLSEFKRHWCSDGDQGVAILFETTPAFFAEEEDQVDQKSFRYLFLYLKPYRRLIWQLLLGLLVGGIIQFLFPFLTQSIVDIGISNRDIHFIWLILMGQLMLFAGQLAVKFLQSWILLHIGTRINVSLVSDFLVRLMNQPIGFFDARMTGDLLQRIGDHRRIEQFLTVSMLNILFSAFTLLIFGIVLAVYNLNIFIIFLISSFLYLIWIRIFLSKRKDADYLRFRALSENQSSLIELIQGMQEIKLQNSERKRRYSWVHIQAKLFRANIKSLSVTQWQDAGAQFITQVKDIIITVVAANAVISGDLTLGMMLAIMFILGQLNIPLQQIITFIREGQDARISLERLGEIHSLEPAGVSGKADYLVSTEQPDNHTGPEGFMLENVSFRYNALADFVLKNITLEIPKGKVTAVVGASGSGKTTLIKLLLGFYEPTQGQIRTGSVPLTQLDPSRWRSRCGAVMQDGFIFSDTIASNIAESEADWDVIDKQKLLKAAQTAHILDFIENLPLGYNTMIGARGNGLSQGQRQRLLIARAVYKEPDYLFFDEATNALDAHTEKLINQDLNDFFSGKTVVVVAHRLSTVKNADQIVVLDKGTIAEKGTHAELTALKGIYYTLVKEQLELGA